MRKSLKIKIGALGATAAMAGALAIAASGTTGAYFSETKDGGLTGTIGAVHLDASPVNFIWDNMMPGAQKSATVHFQNTGTGPQDFYLVFNNRPALHALNQLGTYGEVHVTSQKDGDVLLPVFDSANLQDGRHGNAANPGMDTGFNSCGGVFASTPVPKDGCWPLPANLKIASDVAQGYSGVVTFSFGYAAKMADHQGTAFNPYPLMLQTDSNDTADITPSTPGVGLPFQVVAVQVGQTP
jgi:hypothetical protein